MQNGWKKPLIIWVCNRFDYSDQASLDCDFPDQEYYSLFNQACTQENVRVIAYTDYERHYARLKGIDISLLIKPSGKSRNSLTQEVVFDAKKSRMFFLPPYHNETKFMDAVAFYQTIGINSFCGRYNGAEELKAYKAIIHLPYAWSNLALFENLYLGNVYLLPSREFMKTLIHSDNYFHTSNTNEYYLSEWYAQENAPCFIYFDSWEDLAKKTKIVNFYEQRKVVHQLGQAHAQEMFARWNGVVADLCKNQQKCISRTDF